MTRLTLFSINWNRWLIHVILLTSLHSVAEGLIPTNCAQWVCVAVDYRVTIRPRFIAQDSETLDLFAVTHIEGKETGARVHLNYKIAVGR